LPLLKFQTSYYSSGKIWRSEKTEGHSFTTVLPFASTKESALWMW